MNLGIEPYRARPGATAWTGNEVRVRLFRPSKDWGYLMCSWSMDRPMRSIISSDSRGDHLGVPWKYKRRIIANHQRGVERNPSNEECHLCKRRRFKETISAGGFNPRARNWQRRTWPTVSKAPGSDAGSALGPTGGTTGLPKSFPRTHNDLILQFRTCGQSWKWMRDTCLLVGPSVTTWLSPKVSGQCFKLWKNSFFWIPEPWRYMQKRSKKERVTSLVWVPTLARRLVGFEVWGNYDPAPWKRCTARRRASLPDLIKEVQGEA